MDNPVSFGLPDKFTSWRPNQFDAAVRIALSDKRFTMISAPPGVGKTVAYMAAHTMLGGRTLILTNTKHLQDQLADDFSTMGLQDLRGRNNYPCEKLLDTGLMVNTCDVGPCTVGEQCDLKPTILETPLEGFTVWSNHSGCDYYDALKTASQAELVVTNYAWWVSSLRNSAYPTPLGRFDTLIMDEAHLAADVLVNLLKFQIRYKEAEKFISMPAPKVGSSLQTWGKWAILVERGIERSYEASVKEKAAPTRIKALRVLKDKINALSSMGVGVVSEKDWIIRYEEDRKFGDKAEFSPVWAKPYAGRYLFASIARIALVSATITKRDASYLGIDSKQLDIADYPSPFKVKNRPITYAKAPAIKFTSTLGDRRAAVRVIDGIIGKRLDRKGLIHTASYHWAREIFSLSKHSSHMILNAQGGAGIREAVDAFRSAEAPCVLVSPAIATGLDFPHDLARYQIVAKLPFPPLKDPVIARRREEDKRYYSYDVVSSLMQMAGRIVRSEDDYGETFITDGNYRWFWRQNKNMFPKWYLAAMRMS